MVSKHNDELKQEKIKEHYDDSEYYDTQKKNFADKKTRFNQYISQSVFSVYSPHKNEKVLDLGCGWGNISLELQKRGHDVIGLDYSKKAINICKNTATKLGLNSSKFVCKDATKTDFESEHFDVVYCADLAEHLYPKVFIKLLKETYRVLKKGGKLIVFTPCPSHIFEILKKNNILLKKDITHVNLKSMKRLTFLLTKYNFEIVKAYYISSHVPILSFFENVFKNFTPIFRRRIAILAKKR